MSTCPMSTIDTHPEAAASTPQRAAGAGLVDPVRGPQQVGRLVGTTLVSGGRLSQ